jgi:hypothetical protein
MKNHSRTLRSASLAAAMAAALAFGGYVQAQPAAPGITSNNNDAQKAETQTKGPKTADERTQAKVDKQQAAAAKRAARKSRMAAKTSTTSSVAEPSVPKAGKGDAGGNGK